MFYEYLNEDICFLDPEEIEALRKLREGGGGEDSEASITEALRVFKNDRKGFEAWVARQKWDDVKRKSALAQFDEETAKAKSTIKPPSLPGAGLADGSMTGEKARSLYADDPASFAEWLSRATLSPAEKAYEQKAYDAAREAEAKKAKSGTLAGITENLREEQRVAGLTNQAKGNLRSEALTGLISKPVFGPNPNAAQSAAPLSPEKTINAGGGVGGMMAPPSLVGAQQTLYDAATKAGFSGEAALRAVATAWAESPKARKGDWTDYNPNGEDSVGPMQINLRAHAKNIPGATFEEKAKWLQDPYNAMQAAYRISSGGTDFSPWSVWHESIKTGDGKTLQVGAPAAKYFAELASGAGLAVTGEVSPAGAGLVGAGSEPSEVETGRDYEQGWQAIKDASGNLQRYERPKTAGAYTGTEVVDTDKKGNPYRTTVGWKNPIQGDVLDPTEGKDGAWWARDAATAEQIETLRRLGLDGLIQHLRGQGEDITGADLRSPPGGIYEQGDQPYLRNNAMIEKTGFSQDGYGMNKARNPFNPLAHDKDIALNSATAVNENSDEMRQYKQYGDIAGGKSGKTLAQIVFANDPGAAERAGFDETKLDAMARGQMGTDETNAEFGTDPVRDREAYERWLRYGRQGPMPRAEGGIDMAGTSNDWMKEAQQILNGQVDTSSMPKPRMETLYNPQTGEWEDMGWTFAAPQVSTRDKLQANQNTPLDLRPSPGYDARMYNPDGSPRRPFGFGNYELQARGGMGMAGGGRMPSLGSAIRWPRPPQPVPLHTPEILPPAENGVPRIQATGNLPTNPSGNSMNNAGWWNSGLAPLGPNNPLMRPYYMADGGSFTTEGETLFVDADTGDVKAIAGEPHMPGGPKKKEAILTVPLEGPASDPLIQQIQQMLLGGQQQPITPTRTPPNVLRNAAQVMKPRVKVALGG